MPESFFDLPKVEQKAILAVAEDRLGFPDHIIEKDLWVCWILEQLFMLPLKMAFKGGTSLSKVYRLIHRFSEDVDITIDYKNVLGEIDLQKISRSKLKQLEKDLKKHLKDITENQVLSHLNKQLKSNSFMGVEVVLSEDGEKLKFYYPTLEKRNLGYLRDHVLIEFGIRNSTEPFEKHKIEPFLKEILGDSISLPQPLVDTLSPIRTFWEKATLIHVECHRKRLTHSPERLSRHWYDLYMLYLSSVGQEALNKRKVLEDVIDHKTAFFNASYAHYDRCLNGEFRLIPDHEDKLSLKKDYQEMINSGMFHGEVPEFKVLIDSLHDLERLLKSTF